MKSNPERLLGNNTIADAFGDKDPRYKLVDIGKVTGLGDWGIRGWKALAGSDALKNT